MGDTVGLTLYSTALEAHFARGALARLDIPAFVEGEATGTLWGVQVGARDGIRLIVRREDADSAAAALPRAAPPASPEEAAVAADQWARRLRAFSIVLFGVGPGPTGLMFLVVAIYLALFSSRIADLSPSGRRLLRHARIVCAVLVPSLLAALSLGFFLRL